MWKEYLVASGTEEEPEKKKVALLMNVIGCEAAKIVFKIVNIEEEKITADKVLEALKKKMSPEINSTALKCPAKNKTCFKCNKKGHFSHVCHGEAVLKEVTRASAIENDTDVLKIEKSGTNGVYSNLNFVLGNSKVESVRCQLDTGASCNVIGHNQLKRILGKVNFSWRNNTFIPIQSLTNLWMYLTALAE
ncbi:uncharacterized protein LOC113469766 [Diaphorina citri]|uniref:Uncharacterized protein LOC113469766 n=1 Tax=Diaphorina citri TaxID=121845 RepID=A0A3Q0J937_DIACI|nr:uncharacterized protein LOC113469766 [Diaphorina citri]